MFFQRCNLSFKIKIVAAVLLTMCVVFSLCSCGNSTHESFDKCIEAIKKGDFNRFRLCATEGSGQAVDLIRNKYELLDEEQADVLLSLLSYINVGYYDDDIESKSEKMLRVTLTYVDLNALSADVAAEISVSGIPAAEIISGFIDSGRIDERYVKTADIEVKMIEVDGTWQIPFSIEGNNDLVSRLGLYAFTRWLANQR